MIPILKKIFALCVVLLIIFLIITGYTKKFDFPSIEKDDNYGNNLSNLINSGYIAYNEDYIIYNTPDLVLNKIDRKGKITPIYKYGLIYLNIVNDKIYGINSDNKIICMDLTEKM